VKTAAVAAALLLLLTAGQALTLEPAPVKPAPAVEASTMVSAKGTLTYVTTLETPHWEVDGWVLQVSDPGNVLQQLKGRQVKVTGTPYTGMSIMMKRTLTVSAVYTTLEGTLQQVDGRYELNGWTVEDDGAQLQPLACGQVQVTGAVVLGKPANAGRVLKAESVAAVQTEANTKPDEERATSQGAEVQVEGVLQMERSLETPHFVVNGWAISGADQEALAALVGKHVVIKGAEFTGPSILMRRQLVVKEVQAEVRAPLQLVTEMESPHYEIDGLVVLGDAAQLQALSGQEVTLVGTLVTGPSIYMKPALTLKSVAAAPLLPSAVMVNGKPILLPTQAVRKDGQLMLPLRAVVEAAGGTVTWNAEQWAVAVQLNGNASLVRIGQVTADAAGPAPQIVDGYTLVSVAFLQNLGLEVRWQGSVLHLSRPEGGSNAQ
jgi:hypothetical protein